MTARPPEAAGTDGTDGTAPVRTEPATAPGRALARSLEWQREGTEVFVARAGALDDEEFAAPSLLTGWSRAHLVAHVARNAEALANLLDWARTGVETPMYASPGRREADIAAGARQEPAELRRDLAASRRRLAEATDRLPAASWDARVRSAQGRDIPAAEVPWMRVREVWLHAVDLGTGLGFGDLPHDLVGALLDDVTAGLARKPGAPDVVLEATDGARRRWRIGGPEGAARLSGPAHALLGWATGRRDGTDLVPAGTPLPDLPRWL